ncbi:MAG: alpha/beta hydrolase fold domain-containing protein [Gemmataceae bacterium]
MSLSFRVLVLAVGMASLGCASLRSRSADSRLTPTPAPVRPGQADRAPAPTIHPVSEQLDVVYGHAGGEDLQLDLFAPKDVPGPFPAVVILHGGGWAKGSHDLFRPLAGAVAAHGYVAATVGYRMAPRHKYPAQIQDAKCAVRWLRANAERYRIDSEHIGALGFSAGAHLALLLGLTEAKDGLEGNGGNPEHSSKVQAIVNISGPTDLTRPEWPDATKAVFVDFLGGNAEQLPGLYRAASPVAYIRRGAPPVLTIHGTSDSVVPYEQAQLLHATLRRAKVNSKLTPLHGKDHGENWTAKEQQRNAAAILDFLDKNLRR